MTTEETTNTATEKDKDQEEITALVLCQAYLSQVDKSDSMSVLIEPKAHGKSAYAAFSVFDKKFKVTFEEVKRARRLKVDIEKPVAEEKLSEEEKPEDPKE